MKLKSIEITNFLSVGEINLDLDNRGMVLICGENKDNPDFESNGAGKSSIADAIVYALYGKTVRGISGDEIVNRVTGKDCQVSLTIEDDNGDIYLITRYRKHKKFKNAVQLTLNGVDITPKSSNDFTQAVEDLIQMDYLTFTSSILYSASSFRFTSATDAELKEAFDTILGLDIYTECLDLVRADIKEMDATLLELESDIKVTEKSLETAKENLAATTEQKDQWENDKLAKAKELKERFTELQGQSATVSKKLEEQLKLVVPLEAKRPKLENAVADAKTKLKAADKAKDAVREVEETILDIKKAIGQHELSIKKLKSNAENVEEKRDDIVEQLKELSAEYKETKKGGTCPTCGQSLTKEMISDALKKIKAKSEKLVEKDNTLAETIDEYMSDIEKEEELLASSQEGLQAATTELETAKGKIDTKALEALENALSAAEDALDDHDDKVRELKRGADEYANEVKLINSKYKSIKGQYNELSGMENPHAKSAEKFKSAIKSANSELKAKQAEIEQLEDDKRYLQFWAQGYGLGGIRNKLIDTVAPYLSRLANKYLSKMAGDRMEILFSTISTLKNGETREKFSIEVSNQDGSDSYGGQSAGEKRRTDIAVALALQSLVSTRAEKNLNVLILDEAFENLDANGSSSVVDLLGEVAEGKSSVFVISHDDKIKSNFTETITIVKENGLSRLAG